MSARAEALPARSAWLVAWFKRHARRYVGRSFSAVRAGGAGTLPTGEAPVIVYCNHAAWWDPLLCALLATAYMNRRDHWALIDAVQLERYRFFARLGFVGVEPGTPAGARRLIALGHALAGRADATLWLTPQGRFADPRERPLVLAAGLGRLARLVPEGRFVPLAIEYPFAEERLPEARALFGAPLAAAELVADPEGTDARLAHALTETADRLAALTVARSSEGLETLLEGRAGVGGVYDLWRRARAAFRGERFDAAHGRRAAGTDDGAAGDAARAGERS